MKKDIIVGRGTDVNKPVVLLRVGEDVFPMTSAKAMRLASALIKSAQDVKLTECETWDN